MIEIWEKLYLGNFSAEGNKPSMKTRPHLRWQLPNTNTKFNGCCIEITLIYLTMFSMSTNSNQVKETNEKTSVKTIEFLDDKIDY